jgi:hypothetical protein
MSLGLHGDDSGRPSYLELEVGVAGFFNVVVIIIVIAT